MSTLTTPSEVAMMTMPPPTHARRRGGAGIGIGPANKVKDKAGVGGAGRRVDFGSGGGFGLPLSGGGFRAHLPFVINGQNGGQDVMLPMLPRRRRARDACSPASTVSEREYKSTREKKKNSSSSSPAHRHGPRSVGVDDGAPPFDLVDFVIGELHVPVHVDADLDHLHLDSSGRRIGSDRIGGGNVEEKTVEATKNNNIAPPGTDRRTRRADL